MTWIVIVLGFVVGTVSFAHEECQYSLVLPAGAQLTSEYTHAASEETFTRPAFVSEEVFSLMVELRLLKREQNKLTAPSSKYPWKKSVFAIGKTKKEEVVEEVKRLIAQTGEKIKAVKKQERPGLIQTVKDAVKDPVWSQTVMVDMINYYRLKEIKSFALVSLLVGDTTLEEAAMLSRVTELVNLFKKKGRAILFDADAASAPVLKQLTGAYGIGVGRSRTADVVIRDPYLRYKAFSYGQRSVATADSLPALALALQNELSFVMDVNDDYGPLPNRVLRFPENWPMNIPQSSDLGLKFNEVRKRLKPKEIVDYVTPGGIIFEPEVYFKPLDPKVTLDALKKIQNFSIHDLSYEQATRVLATAQAHAVGKRDLTLSGIAFFGSAKTKGISKRISNYNIIYELASKGLAVTTGGSDGYMLVGNAAAFAAGSSSIGLPIGGANALESEELVPRSVHTETQVLPNYASRIPLLLEGKQAIVFAPGRMGTMKELAATLLAMKDDPNLKVVFTDNDYYAFLYHYLQKIEASKSLVDRISVLEKPEEVSAFVLGADGDDQTLVAPSSTRTLPPAYDYIPLQMPAPKKEKKRW